MALKVYIGSQLAIARAFAGVMAEQRPVKLVAGQGKGFVSYILPARGRSGRDESTWADEIDLLYGPDAKDNTSRHVTVHDLRNQSVVARILMEAVDQHWRPAQFGVIVSGDEEVVHWGYIVPGLPYWRVRVGEGNDDEH